MRPFFGSWKQIAFRGVAAVLFGVATLLWPSITLWTLVVLWGAYAFVDGITALVAAITDHALAHRGWLAIAGVSGIAAGVVTFLWPSITALGLLWVIAMWAFFVGGSRIALAITTRKQLHGTVSLALGGIFLLLLGVLLVVDPGVGALGVTWAIGWLAIFFGGQELWLASVVRHETRDLTTPTGFGTSRPGHAVS